MAEGLFPKISNRTIKAFDIYGKEHLRELKNFKFRVSAYGVLIENNKVLIKRNPLISTWELPGGGIELGESIEDGLVREFQEESGVIVKIGVLLNVEDSLFTFNEEDAHSVLVFYEVKRIGGTVSANYEDSVEAKFVDLNYLNRKNTQRSFWNIIELVQKMNLQK